MDEPKLSLKDCLKLFETNQYQAALEGVLQVLESSTFKKQHQYAYEFAGICYAALKEYEKAIEYLQTGMERFGQTAGGLYNLALCYRNVFDYHKAIECYKTSIRLDPLLAKSYHNLYALYDMLGQHEQAKGVLNAALKQFPFSTTFVVLAVDSFYDIRISTKQLKYFKQCADDNTLPSDKRVRAYHILAKHEEAQSDFNRAWQYYERSNTLLRQTRSYDIDNDVRYCNYIIKLFSQAFLQSNALSEDCELVPVFILGMPRAGKSLLEGWLAKSSCFALGGEIGYINHQISDAHRIIGSKKPYPSCADQINESILQRWRTGYQAICERVSPDGCPVLNTLPHNVYHVGWINILFPRAKFIYVAREPMDLILQNYFKYFANGNAYACDLPKLVQHHDNYERLITHWNTVLPSRLLSVSYENLVQRPQETLQNVFDFLGVNKPIQFPISVPHHPKIGYSKHFPDFTNRMHYLVG